MAPKRRMGLEVGSDSGSKRQGGTRATHVKKGIGKGHVTRAQSRVHEVARFYHNQLPSPVREELE